MTLTLYFLKGRFNLPLYDAELNKQGFNVQSIAPIAISNSQMYWDDTQLTNVGTFCDNTTAGSANNLTGAGIDNTLTGTPSPARAWSGNANPSQVIPAPAVGANETDDLTCNDYGNVRLLNTYGWGLTNQSVTAVVFKGCSDLRVLKTVNIPSPNVGSNVTFTITASNLGISNDTNVVVNDVLPSGYTVVSATPSVGTWSAPNWTIGNFANGANATLTVVATVLASGNYSNTATITGTNNDPNLANNTATAATTPNAVADLAVVKIASTLTPIKGTNITFTITATNNGPSPAIGVAVNDIIPTGYTLVSATPVTGSWTSPTWTIGNLAVGASTTLTVVATVNATGNYANTATISGTLTDLVPGNNSSTVTPVPVNAVIDAVDDIGNPVNGYTGGTSFTNVLINDTLNGNPVVASQVNTTFVSSTSPGVTLSGTNVVVAPGTPVGNYVLTYRICEIANPTNCDTATVRVPVTAAPIDAVNDTGSSINGTVGGTSFTNVLSNDTLNNVAVIPSQITTTFVSSTNAGVTLSGTNVVVAPGTPAGNYTLTYRICEILNPTNCDTAVVTVPVTAAAIVAQDDTMPSTNGFVGNNNLGNVLPNNGNGPDTLNGTALANLSLVTMTVVTPATPLTPGAPVPVLNPATGQVSVPAGTPAATYTITYQICEILNPANCDPATVTIPVTAATIDAVNDTTAPTNGTNGNTNAGNVLTSNGNGPDTLNGNPVTISQVAITVTTPATPVTPGAPVPSVNPATGVISIPANTPAGNYTITYQICEILNPSNCDSAVVTVPVTAAAIVAQDDTMPSTNGLIGNNNLGNVLPNNGNGPDTLNGTALANLSLVTMTVVTPATPLTPGAPVPVLNPATGQVSVPAGTPAATYTITYQICEILNPANCDPATVTIPVTAATIDAVNDTTAPTNGTNGNTNAGNVLTSNGNGPDTLNGNPITISQVAITVTTPATPVTPGAPVPSVNPATGVISIPANTPAGNYTITYQICEILNPSNCDSAVVTVPVTAAAIVAQDDTMPSTNGLIGNNNLGNVLPNNGNGPDTLNGTALANLSLVTMTVVTPATPLTPGAPVPVLNPATGQVSVPAGTPAATYTITYQICEILNPANCDPATVTIPVTAATIDAVNDTTAPTNGTNGNTNAGNVLTSNGNGPRYFKW